MLIDADLDQVPGILHAAIIPIWRPGSRAHGNQWRVACMSCGLVSQDGIWCPGPESNRHGVATEGFSYPLQFSLLRSCNAHLWSGLSLCHIVRLPVTTQAGAVKSLHFPGHYPGLSSGLPPPSRAEVSPTLTPFTPGVSSLGAQLLKSLASTSFATRAGVNERYCSS